MANKKDFQKIKWHRTTITNFPDSVKMYAAWDVLSLDPMVSHLIEKCGVNRFIKELESRLDIGITYYYLEKLKPQGASPPPSAEARIDKSKVGESYASTSLKTHRYQPYSTPHSNTPRFSGMKRQSPTLHTFSR